MGVVLLDGTSGIGFATAVATGRAGAEVIAGSSRETSVKRALAELPHTAHGQAVDLTQPEVVRALFDGLGEIDHRVFTAGEAPESTVSKSCVRSSMNSTQVRANPFPPLDAVRTSVARRACLFDLFRCVNFYRR
jgi:NADP-dependent 3-hydroxy acid dehydrogenase YdfG